MKSAKCYRDSEVVENDRRARSRVGRTCVRAAEKFGEKLALRIPENLRFFPRGFCFVVSQKYGDERIKSVAVLASFDECTTELYVNTRVCVRVKCVCFLRSKRVRLVDQANFINYDLRHGSK